MTVKTLLSTTIFNGSITEIPLPTGYSYYYLEIVNVPQPDGTNRMVQLRVGTSGTPDSTAANYSTQRISFSATSLTGTRITTNGGVHLRNGSGVGSGEFFMANVRLFWARSATIKTSGTFWSRILGVVPLINRGVFTHHAAATDHSSIFFGFTSAEASTSALTAATSGTAYLYGEK